MPIGREKTNEKLDIRVISFNFVEHNNLLPFTFTLHLNN